MQLIHLLAFLHLQSWRSQLGFVTWHLLHTIAARFPEASGSGASEAMNVVFDDYRRAVVGLLRSLQYIYPCESCRNNLNRALHTIQVCALILASIVSVHTLGVIVVTKSLMGFVPFA